MPHRPDPHRRRHRERDARPRRVRRLDESAAAHSGDRRTPPGCSRRRSTTGSGSTARRRAWSTRCRTGRAVIPTVPGVHGRRRARGDAASRAAWGCCTATCSRRPATRSTQRSTGGKSSERRRARARTARVGGGDRSRRRHHGARRGAPRRADEHGGVSARQPRAGRLGHQSDGDRSVGRSTPTACTAIAVRRGCSPTSATRSSAVKGHGPTGRSRAGDVIVLIGNGPVGHRHAGDRADHHGAPLSALGQTRGARHRRPVLRACRAARASATSVPEALDGGPIGRVRDDDLIEIVIDRNTLTGTVNLVGAAGRAARPGRVRRALLADRAAASGCLRPTSGCPATLACGPRCSGRAAAIWAGCVYDVDRIVAALDAAAAVDRRTPDAQGTRITRRFHVGDGREGFDSTARYSMTRAQQQRDGDGRDHRDQPRQHEAVVQQVLPDSGCARLIERDGCEERAVGRQEEVAAGGRIERDQLGRRHAQSHADRREQDDRRGGAEEHARTGRTGPRRTSTDGAAQDSRCRPRGACDCPRRRRSRARTPR